MLLSGKTLRHVLVIGVDGVRFDLLGPEVTPVIWGSARVGTTQAGEQGRAARQPSARIHQVLQRSEDGQPDIFCVLT